MHCCGETARMGVPARHLARHASKARRAGLEPARSGPPGIARLQPRRTGETGRATWQPESACLNQYLSCQFSLVTLPQCQMNLTPTPFELGSFSPAQPSDHTTCALTVRECSVSGILMVNATISFNRSGSGQQINAPCTLRFFISP